MHFARIIICLLVLCSSSQAGNQVVQLHDDVRIPLPKGWEVTPGLGDFPYQLTSKEISAELLVFKSIIAKDQAVHDKQGFRHAVDSVIDVVIMQLPRAEVLINQGFLEGDKAWFVIEFLTLDTVTAISLWHRIQGTLYQAPEGHQLLFTLWGRVAPSVSSEAELDFVHMMDGFAYGGQIVPDVFGTPSDNLRYYVGAMFALVIFYMLARRRQQQMKRVGFAERETLWRCECGRLNHRNSGSCRRCGREAELQDVT